jgi:hypothetical protein
VGRTRAPKFLERKLEPGRTETAAIVPPTELTRRIGWAPHDFSHHQELNLTLIVARKFDQRIVIGSDTIMRKWAARPFLHIRRQFGRELAMSRFLQQRAGEVIEQLTARSAVSLHDRDPSHRG